MFEKNLQGPTDPKPHKIHGCSSQEVISEAKHFRKARGIGLKKILLTACLIFLASSCNRPASGSNQNQTSPSLYTHQLQIGTGLLKVQVVSSQQDMNMGLSNRVSMEENQGMLFDFTAQNPQGTDPAFWMKDMNFPLDFIWINKNKVVGVTPNIPPPAPNTPEVNLVNYYPPSPVTWVVEVNAGWAKKNNITVGSDVVLK